MTPTDDILKNEPYYRPGHVIDSAGGRNGTRSREDDGEVDIADPGLRPFQRDDPPNKGSGDTDKEEE